MIRVAIKTALPVGTNDLPQVFRIATDVADILARLEPDKANLEDRIAALEVQVAALTAALQIAEARAEAEAALAEGYKSELEGKDTDVEGFWSSYKKTTGEEVAKHQFFFAKAGFVYYLATLLGPNHPLIKTLFEVLGKF